MIQQHVEVLQSNNADIDKRLDAMQRMFQKNLDKLGKAGGVKEDKDKAVGVPVKNNIKVLRPMDVKSNAIPSRKDNGESKRYVALVDVVEKIQNAVDKVVKSAGVKGGKPQSKIAGKPFGKNKPTSKFRTLSTPMI